MARLILLAGLMLAIQCSAQNTKTQTESVQQVIIKIFDGFGMKDAQHILRYCTDDIMIIENGVVWNRDSIITKVGMIPPELVRVNSFEFLKTDIKGEIAWVAYKNKAEVTLKGKRKVIIWIESAVVVKEADSWMLKMLHSTVLERKAID
jgi:ketosteroid isomerase-like protein